MSEYTRGMYYQQLADCAVNLKINVQNMNPIFFDERLADSAERFVSRMRADISKLDRIIEEARERIAREHNAVAAE